jgi:hypothetical protein
VAKEDFCYTHYDGDEARDMAHMNRLERGAYTDLRVFQRKVGHLSLDQIKKVLSKDFEECWPGIELVLKQDEDGKYFIEWLENSLQRAKRHSSKQSNNGKNGGRPPKNKPKQNPDETQTKPNEGGVGETIPQGIVPDMLQQFKALNPDYPTDQTTDFPALLETAKKIASWQKLPGDVTRPKNIEPIKCRWGELVVFIRAHTLFGGYSLSQVNKHFQSIVQSFNSDRNGKNQSGRTTTKQTASTGHTGL